MLFLFVTFRQFSLFKDCAIPKGLIEGWQCRSIDNGLSMALLKFIGFLLMNPGTQVRIPQPDKSCNGVKIYQYHLPDRDSVGIAGKISVPSQKKEPVELVPNNPQHRIAFKI
jgi:hypothetical protein